MGNEINENDVLIQAEQTELAADGNEYINVLRRHVKDNPEKALMARHRLWMNSVQHEYPLPYMPFRIGVYIRYYNQTRHDNYIEKHRQQFIDDIAMCPKWTLVDFYIDKGLNDGIYEGCNVLCDDGLLGIVIESYGDYARVRAIIDDRANVTGEIGTSGYICNVEGSLTTMNSGYLLASDIDKNAIISEGDKVITSSVSDRYLYGITIGYVTSVEQDSNNLTQTAKITPTVNFTDIKDVMVIVDRKQEVNY